MSLNDSSIRQLPRFVALESVRHLEEGGAHLPHWYPGDERLGLDELLLRRANFLLVKPLRDALHRARRVLYGVIAAVTLVLMLVAVLSTVQLFGRVADHSGNFFWLLFVLLGFNLLSMVVWSISLWLPQKSTPGLVMTSFHQLQKWFQRSPYQVAAAKTWIGLMAQPTVSRWFIAEVGHLIWFGVMIAVSLTTLFVLAFQQVDFVWESTLLSPQVFVNLTEILAAMPKALGIPVPSSDLVAASQLGGTVIDPVAARELWANLLLSALLVYGVVPRLMLVLFSSLMLAKRSRGAKPNMRMPYYVVLAEQLRPGHSEARVIDSDSVGSDRVKTTGGESKTLPSAGIFGVGLELATAQYPPIVPQPVHWLGNITDRDSEASTASAIAELGDSPLLFAVTGQLFPDRGMARYPGVLAREQASQCWIGVLDGSDEVVESWRLLMRQQGFDPSQVVALPTATANIIDSNDELGGDADNQGKLDG